MGNAPDTSAVANNSAPGQARPGLVTANYTPKAELIQVEPAAKPLDVTFQNGLLAIKANKATLSEVLLAVQQQTGAEVSIAAGADQEKVVVDLGPAPAPEVLAQLLHGSNFNFLILSSTKDPRQLDRVILTPRTEGGAMPLAQVQNNNSNDPQEDVPPAQAPPAPQPVASRPPDVNNPPEENAPDQ
jgi:hypothetical protein